jgi:hypothetical protein
VSSFAPGAGLHLKYDPAKQTGTAIDDLSIWTYDPALQSWQALDTSIDTGLDVATAQIGHLSLFAILETADSDLDGCRDAEELMTYHAFGGDRDPMDAFDFYDVTGDAAIDLQDALAILERFGAQPGEAEYDPLFDRYAPDAGKPWRTATAVGEHVGIDLQDALVNLQSFGHSCAGAP